jgi:hypothetical protein
VLRRSYAARILRGLNNEWEQKLNALVPPEAPPVQEELHPAPAQGGLKTGPARRTALQVINQMIQARMSQAIVVKLDDCGRLTDGQQASDEYKKLTERGIAVLGAGVTALYLEPAVETQLLANWTTSWLSNARGDRARIDRLNLAYTEQGRHKALLDHAVALCEALNRENAGNVPAAVRALLQGNESEIRSNDRLLGRVGSELDSLQSLEKWLEEKQP